MPLFPDRPRLSQEEIEKRLAAFGKRCREIFDRVSPELIKDHYDWAIMIEPDSGDYFIAQDPKVAFQKAREKHPTADILEMRLNETGTCGRT
ncbi:MAG: hypothetical protein GDA43_03530 [Hormoscilla sp. SP5CHS1]|nr:hypothetical protein [Hormoscilla sp. SP12CHS1]MBC6452375.1 hypothetical protein [Hormoscilla sp. SP5CHS1]